MLKALRTVLAGAKRGERGQALALTLVLLLLGGLVLTPLLSFMATGLRTGEVYQGKADRLYAADAGLEDAKWNIESDRLGTLFTSPAYADYDFATDYTYNLAQLVNTENTSVTISNIWVPKDIAVPGESTARGIITAAKLVVTGTVTTATSYKIKVQYYPGLGENLTVGKLGVWLPSGFSYVAGSSNLEANPGAQYYSVPVTQPHAGNQAVIWSFSSLPWTSFPGVNPSDTPMATEITFQFTTATPGRVPLAVSWIETGGVSDIPFSWDADTRVYHITSTAGDTTVEAYLAGNEIRKLGSAISGDYRAIGNSLLIDANHDGYVRETLLAESSATVNDIPADAEVALAYLYWSGWFQSGSSTNLFSDTCSSLAAWTLSGSSGNQTRVPTAEGEISGTWNTAPCWDDVDETTPNDADYMTGTTDSGGYMLFTSAPFSIPAGSPITDLRVYVRARDASSGTNNIRPSIKVNGTRYNTTASSNNPGSSFATYSYSYATNPATGLAWVAEDINGTGTRPLQQFGVYSSDLNPDVQVSMVYAAVNWGNDSRWSASGGQFVGQGSPSATTAQRTLTKTTSLDLSSYPSGTVSVSWDQDESGTLEATDNLTFSFSRDGGTTWGPDIEAFHDDNPDASFTYTVPDAYMTNNFKMRLSFSFDATDEYVYLDNIRVIHTIMDPDPTCTFKIDGTQVYFDGTGHVQTGAQPLTADTSQVINNSDYGNPHGYSYASKKDVTELIRTFSAKSPDPATNHPGNATYTVGSVNATWNANDEWAYAGWSLMIIYSSAATRGHQLYLYDTFSYCNHYTNLDFDHDGQPGGTISGFIVPNPVAGEVNAAKMTVFVGEGDACYSGDYLQFNGSSLSDGTGGGTSNVWNGESVGMSAAGVDVDTFNITWASGLLSPGDTAAQVDMYTDVDIWNLVYIILSFRSETTTGGALSYLIRG